MNPIRYNCRCTLTPYDKFWEKKIKKYEEVKPKKRFELSEPFGMYLVDDGEPLYHWINDDDKIIDLLNDLNNRADRNAELVGMEKIELKYQRDLYRDFNREVRKILDKYSIDSLKKLDLVLFHQRLW